MTGEGMSREQLLREFADAYERTIATATDVARRGVTRSEDGWGPRETIAHMAGWEVMATARIPHIAAGMAPLEFEDEARNTVMTDAINATIVTMAGDQSLEALCDILRQAYRRDIEVLRALDERLFQPGNYVYERTKDAIEHCQEHAEMLVSASSEVG